MKRIHWKIVVVGCFLILGVVLISSTEPDKESPLVSTPNLTKHPIYSKYLFSTKDHVIRMGVQPLYLPSSLIMETLKRDTILREELSNIGFEILFFDFLKGDDVNFFLGRGDIDAGIGGDMPTLTAAANLDIVIPVMIQRGFISIVANRHMLVEQLKRKRIGYAFGSNAHYALLKTLASAGLSENDVKLVPVEVSYMPEALDAGKITAFSAWEPTPTIALRNYANSIIIHQRLSLGFFYFLETLYQKHPEAVFHILAAQIRAIRWMQDKRQNLFCACEWNIAASKKAFGIKTNLSVDDIAAIAMKDILGQTSNLGITEDTLKVNGPLDQELRFLVSIEKADASVSWTQIRKKFQPEILNKVWSNRDKFRIDEFKYINTDCSIK